MDYKLIWTKSAIRDLGGIIRYLAKQKGPEVARKIGYGIYDTVQILQEFPAVGSALLEKDDECWRKLI